MKKFTFLIACIFLMSFAGCIPFKRVNAISKMQLSGLNARAADQDLFNNCTLYRMEESFGVSGYDRSLYEDADGSLYFFYDSFCESPFRIKIITQKKEIEVKPILKDVKEQDIQNTIEVPLIYLEDPDLKAFSADKAILLSARVKDRHHQKKCDVGIGDIEFELIQAKNIFYLLSILNAKDREKILAQLPDEKLTALIEDHFEDMEDMVKVAKLNANFKAKLYQVTTTSEKIKNKFKKN
jgi:hypothetical protein